MIQEVTPTQLREALRFKTKQGPIVFLHTPFCGTCKLAKRMLEVVTETLPDIQVLSCDINFLPEEVQKWKIESIPCLAIMHHGTVTSKLYSFQGVDNLYRILKPFSSQNTSSHD